MSRFQISINIFQLNANIFFPKTILPSPTEHITSSHAIINWLIFILASGVNPLKYEGESNLANLKGILIASLCKEN